MENENCKITLITPFSYFEKLVVENYEAVKASGLITPETDFYEFMEKLDEETKELAAEWSLPDFGEPRFESELIDCLSVLLNMAKHYNVDVIEGLKANIEKNWGRAKHIDIKEL